MLFIEKKNYLPAEIYDRTYGSIKDNPTIPWTYGHGISLPNSPSDQSDWDFAFCHQLFIHGASTGSLGDRGVEFCKKMCEQFDLKLKDIVRIRMGLITKTPHHVRYHPHTDLDYPHLTALYYLTTCNGPTVIYNKKQPDKENLKDMIEIPCEENKLVIFDGNYYHTPVSQTDKKQRIVIAFNFTVEND